MTENVAGEKRYEEVFGDTFALYSHKEMEEFIYPFQVRFERNKLDARSIFEGKRCFDAGCGNGRGTLFMLMNGAEHVTSYDFSEKNVENTTKFVKDFEYGNKNTVQQGSIAKIPFEDESFDFVWCNGVIMHTETPNACIAEVARILKVGGKSWIYVYGSGGVYWRIIYHLRNLVKEIKIENVIAALKIIRYSTRYIAEYIDDWYATFLRTYTHHDLSHRLLDVGFDNPELLPFGMDYDTSHRRHILDTEEEKALMGEGDLRYLLTKKTHNQTANALVLEGEYGSEYEWPNSIVSQIDPLFETLKKRVEGKPLVTIAICAHIQRELRILLDQEQKFPQEQIIAIIQNLMTELSSIETMI